MGTFKGISCYFTTNRIFFKRNKLIFLLILPTWKNRLPITDIYYSHDLKSFKVCGQCQWSRTFQRKYSVIFTFSEDKSDSKHKVLFCELPDSRIL